MPDVRIIEGATLLAILLGPILAVQANKWVEKASSRKSRKEHVFRTLMATRAARLSPDHVQALNMIDFEFYGGGEKERRVQNAWNDYRDQLNVPNSPETIEVWAQRGNDLFIELLSQMAIAVNYKFEKTHIRKSVYSPVAHGNLEQDNDIIRKGLVDMFSKKFAIPVVTFPANKQEADEQAALRQQLAKLLSGETAYKVVIVNPEALDGNATS